MIQDLNSLQHHGALRHATDTVEDLYMFSQQGLLRVVAAGSCSRGGIWNRDRVCYYY
jgi:hypothetical protein